MTFSSVNDQSTFCVDSLTSRWHFGEGHYVCQSSLGSAAVVLLTPSSGTTFSSSLGVSHLSPPLLGGAVFLHLLRGGAAFLSFSCWVVVFSLLSSSDWEVLISPPSPLVVHVFLYVRMYVCMYIHPFNQLIMDKNIRWKRKKAAPP